MHQDGDNNNVLAQLKRLYSEVVGKINWLRINSYRSTPPAKTPTNSLAALDKYINHMCDQYAPSAHVDNTATISNREHEPTATTTPQTESSYTDLSAHFHKNFPGSSQPRHIADSLRESSWSHINKALNYARHGDRENAHMHAELAQNAIQMVSQYMRDEEYQEFHVELIKRLESLTDEVAV